VHTFKFSKKKFWLICIFPALFIADILYGGMDYLGINLPVTPGIILRGLVLLLSLIMILKYYKMSDRFVLIWLVMLVAFSIPGLVTGIVKTGSLSDIQSLVKVLYGPFVILLVVVLIRKYRIGSDEIIEYIAYSGYVLGLSLLLSQLLGIQKATYGDYAFGSTGIFYAQNDLTLALGLGLFAAMFRLLYDFTLVRLVLISLSAFACLQIGTRSSLLLVLVASMLPVILVVMGDHTKTKRLTRAKRIFRWLMALSVSCLLLGLLSYGVAKQSENTFQQGKLEQIQSGDLPRLYLITMGAIYLSQRDSLLNLTGEGQHSYAQGVGSIFSGSSDYEKLVEVDFIDMYGSYGLIFTSIMYSYFIFLLVAITKNFVWGSKKPIEGLIALSLGVYLGQSVVAGHALTSPIPTTLIAGYIALYLTQIKGGEQWRMNAGQ